MKQLLIAAAATALLATTAEAQNDIPEFNKIRSPTAPAQVVLGLGSTAIPRPTEPADFAASFLDAFEGSSLPTSYAVEVAPYWWFPHPRLSRSRYFSGGFASIARNASFSLAVTDSVPERFQALADSAGYRQMGFGARTTLWNGAPVDTSCVVRIDFAATQRAIIRGRIVADSIAARAVRGIPSTSQAAADSLHALSRRAATAALPDSLAAVLADTAVNRCAESTSARRGLVIDAAAAGGVGFPAAKIDEGDIITAGVWLTPSYLWRNASLVGVLRGLWDEMEGDTTRFSGDLGARGVYAWERYALSAESVFRTVARGDASDNFVRVALTLDAEITTDTWLTLTFGRDFEADRPNSLLAVANLQWNVAKRRVSMDDLLGR